MISGSKIESIGIKLPERIVSTAEIMKQLKVSKPIQLERLTGISNRHVCSEMEDSLTLAVDAVNDCFKYSSWKPDDIEMIICCSISKYINGLNHVYEPPFSALIKQKLGNTKALNFDISNACAGMMTGVYIANNYISPTIIEERQLNIATMDVFSRLMMDRIIFLGVPIDDYVANIIQAQLLFLESVDANKDIQIYLNTPGGSVYAGLGIYDTMQYISPDVATICTGMAASMGAVLLCAGKEGKRTSLPHSRVLIHQPMGGVSGQASDIEITHNEIQKLKKELYEIIARHLSLIHISEPTRPY